MEEKKQKLVEKRKVSAEIQNYLDFAKAFKTLPEKEQKVLIALGKYQSFPWIKIGKDKRGQPTVISIDLSGRSHWISGPELQARFALPISNETISIIKDLPNLTALFAFDTEIDDSGVAQMALLPKLQAVWLPPLATDEGFEVLGKSQGNRMALLGWMRRH